MTDDLSPEAVAASKRERLASIKEQEWQLWRHNPITAGVLQYLDDMIGFYRNSAADLLEAGQFNAGDPHQDKNPDCLRGQIVMLRQIHGLDLGTIHNFYERDDDAQSERDQ